MVINRRSTFFLGVFIFLIPFFGVPSFWKTVFIIFSGVLLVLLSIRVSLPKKSIRISKPKKEIVNPVVVEEVVQEQVIIPEPEVILPIVEPQKPKTRRRKSSTSTSIK